MGLGNDLRQVLDALGLVGFQGECEEELCGAIDRAFAEAGLQGVRREVAIAPRCRIDRVWRRVGVEVKAGSPNVPSTNDQLRRYAASDEIDALVLVTERSIPVPEKLSGKPVHVFNVHHGAMAI